jgi:hypothetical protein
MTFIVSRLNVLKLGCVKYVLDGTIFVGNVLPYGLVLHNGHLLTQQFFAKYFRIQKFPGPGEKLQTIAISRDYHEIMSMFACLADVPKELMDHLPFMEKVQKFILSLEKDWANDRGLSPFQQFEAIKQAANTLVQNHIAVKEAVKETVKEAVKEAVKRKRNIEDTSAAIIQNDYDANTSAKRIRFVIGHAQKAIDQNSPTRSRFGGKEAIHPVSGLI